MVHTPITVQQLREKRKPLSNANVSHRQQLSRLERAALVVTRSVGSMGFFITILVWTASWLLWNIFAPATMRFDPYPAFVLWLFISNMIQIMLLPLIMVGQNLLGKHAEVRAEADFEVNVRAEEEIEALLQHLENQHELMQKVLNKLDGQP